MPKREKRKKLTEGRSRRLSKKINFVEILKKRIFGKRSENDLVLVDHKLDKSPDARKTWAIPRDIESHWVAGE